jgi:hypothetical protein
VIILVLFVLVFACFIFGDWGLNSELCIYRAGVQCLNHISSLFCSDYFGDGLHTWNNYITFLAMCFYFLPCKWLDWNMRCEKVLGICFIPVSRVWPSALHGLLCPSLPVSPLLNWHDELYPRDIESKIFWENLLSHLQEEYARRSQWVW